MPRVHFEDAWGHVVATADVPGNAATSGAVARALSACQGFAATDYRLRFKTPTDDNVVTYVWTDMMGDAQAVPLFDGGVRVRLLDLRGLGVDMPMGEPPAEYGATKSVTRYNLDALPSFGGGDGGGDGGGGGNGGGGGGGRGGGGRRGGGTGRGDEDEDGGSAVGMSAAGATAAAAADAVSAGAKHVGKLFTSVGGFFGKKSKGKGERPAAENLPHILAAASLARDTFSPDENAEHGELLRELWGKMMPGDRPFERRCEAWQAELGFLGPDPVRDFEGSGVLGVHCLLYMATAYVGERRGREGERRMGEGTEGREGERGEGRK
jgi:hypothetical protein